MVQNAISLSRQNQVKLFRQIKTDETETIFRKEKLGPDFLKGFSDARKGWGAPISCLLFGVHSVHTYGELVKRARVKCNWDVFWARYVWCNIIHAIKDQGQRNLRCNEVVRSSRTVTRSYQRLSGHRASKDDQDYWESKNVLASKN